MSLKSSRSLLNYSYEYKLFIDGVYRGSSPTLNGIRKLYSAFCQLAGVSKLDYFIEVECFEYYCGRLNRIGHGHDKKTAKADLSF